MPTPLPTPFATMPISQTVAPLLSDGSNAADSFLTIMAYGVEIAAFVAMALLVRLVVLGHV